MFVSIENRKERREKKVLVPVLGELLPHTGSFSAAR